MTSRPAPFRPNAHLITLLVGALAIGACGTEASTPAAATDAGATDGTGSDAGDAGSTDAVAGSDTAGGDAAGGDTAGNADAKSADAGPAKVNTLLADGPYFIGIKLSLAGTQLRLKAVVSAEGTKGAGGTLRSFDIYGLGAADDWVSEAPIGAVKDVAVKADGTFTASFGKVTIPAKSSPTGTPVDSNLAVVGTVDSDNNTFCGELTGDIPAFEANLKGSTFKAVAFGKQVDPYQVSCATTIKLYEGIKTCPTLKAGPNTFKSAEFDRSFVLNLPASATGTAKLPLVFVYHGNGGNAAGMLTATGWPAIQTGETNDPFILIAPETTADVNGSKPVLDWRYGEKVFDTDNRELVFFDDMIKCVASQYSVDTNRIYVTGMSGGGMMTTFLTANRSKVIAASAPFSGGYLHTWPKGAAKVPMLVIWGGAGDSAFSQNFDLLAKALIKSLTDAGTFFAQCNHKTGHKIPYTLVPHTWTFLKAHAIGQAGAPPFELGLPFFPSYCSVPKK